MEKKTNWMRIIYIIGIVAFIIGTLDPLEGSVVILAGSALISFTSFKTNDRHWKIFLASLIMIIIGVVALFYLSSLGGFGGSSDLSWWWGIFILPYPIAWFMTVITLIVRAFKKAK